VSTTEPCNCDQALGLQAELDDLKEDNSKRGWSCEWSPAMQRRIHKKEVDALQASLDVAEARVQQLESRVAELECTRKDLEMTNQALGDAVMEIDALKARVAELERTQCTESERAILDEGHRLGWTNCTLADRAVLDAMAQVKYARLMQIVRFSTDELVDVAKAELSRRESAK
jgi:hypothetical protein